MSRRCYFCQKNIEDIDFHKASLLTRYITSWGKIKSSHDSHICARHQKKLSKAIKYARYLALVPYTSR